MLGKKEKTTAAVNTAINVIGEGTVIEGNIKSSGDLRIDGSINGNVYTSNKCVLGISGKIVGNIEAKSCDISGEVRGDVKVNELLLFKNSGKINGDITAGKIVMESGGEFNGTCKMGNAVSMTKEKAVQDGTAATA